MNPDNRFNRPHKVNDYRTGSVVDFQMKPIMDPAIASAGYDSDQGVMAVHFNSYRFDGKVYFFRTIPAAVWEEFLAAENKGKFFQERIESNLGHPIDGGYEWCSGHFAP